MQRNSCVFGLPVVEPERALADVTLGELV